MTLPEKGNHSEIQTEEREYVPTLVNVNYDRENEMSHDVCLVLSYRAEQA